MNYEFPIIKNISDVLPAIEGRHEFVVANKGSYTVINYNVMMADTFPDVFSDRTTISGVQIENHDAAIRRELRGIIFDSKTGDIIRRPFHKFFNVNEREETQDHRVDLSRPHAILEKLDGSMIAPFIVDGEMIWGTKMGATDVAKPVEDFIEKNTRYRPFAASWIELGWTPIFEWCSRKQRIVLDYKEDQLVLTAIRNIYDGSYLNINHLRVTGNNWGIPVVRAFEPQTNMKAFLDYVAGLEDLEGFVVRFNGGHMVKLKCHWYLQIHRAKEAILQDRNIVELILDEKLDDVKAHLPSEDRDRLTKFESYFNSDIAHRRRTIEEYLYKLHVMEIDRKTFALEYADRNRIDSYSRSIIFKNFDDPFDREKIEADVHNTIRNNLSKTVKYEAIRDAWFPGVTFNG